MDSDLMEWLSAVPTSKMVYPDSWVDRVKYILWFFLRPIHPYVRDTLSFVGIIKKYDKFRPNGRQHYVLGMLAPGESIRSVAEYLVNQGFGNHFVALKDENEIVNLRYAPSFEYQYHVRIFNDGEVRAHFEYTVEAHPLLHQRGVGFEPRREEFLDLLGERIIPAY